MAQVRLWILLRPPARDLLWFPLFGLVRLFAIDLQFYWSTGCCSIIDLGFRSLISLRGLVDALREISLTLRSLRTAVDNKGYFNSKNFC